MTLRVYKDEYQGTQIDYLRKAFEVVDESAKVMVISGTESELEKVQACMYFGEADFKAVFPDYLTTREREYNTMDLAKDCLMEMYSTVNKMIENGLITDPRLEALRKMSREYYKIVMGLGAK